MGMVVFQNAGRTPSQSSEIRYHSERRDSQEGIGIIANGGNDISLSSRGNFENFKNYSAGMRGSESVILACPESFLFAVVKGAFFISI